MEKSALRCPVCRVELLLAPVDTGELPVCGHCGGTWLDNLRSQRVVKGLISERERALAAQASDQASVPIPGSYRTAPPATAAGPRPCPDCAQPMIRTLAPDLDIELDVCPAHGTWFDARELVAVVERFAPANAAAREEMTALKAELSAAKPGEPLPHPELGARALGRHLR